MVALGEGGLGAVARRAVRVRRVRSTGPPDLGLGLLLGRRAPGCLVLGMNGVRPLAPPIGIHNGGKPVSRRAHTPRVPGVVEVYCG